MVYLVKVPRLGGTRKFGRVRGSDGNGVLLFLEEHIDVECDSELLKITVFDLQ